MRMLLFIMLTLASVQAQDREYWLTEGKKAIHAAVNRRLNTGVAKNTIIFLGDGMGVSTITAARMLKGQMEGGTGAEYRLQMDRFPYSGLLRTYNTDRLVPDSAGTANAFLCGVKSQASVLGVDSSVVKGNCSMMPEANVESLVDWALKEGKSVGLVTTTRVTHATPGAAYAKNPHRDWETDANMKNITGCDHVKDIARQLIEDYDKIQVILGGGRSKFLTEAQGGDRTDGKDLIQLWKDKQKAKGVNYQYVEDGDQFKELPSDTDYLLGLFTMSHMDYDADRKTTGNESNPSIAEMFEKAHMVLSKNKKGYFLLVEGGRIDHAHHDNKGHKSLLETIALDNAVKSAVAMTSEQDTLIMVTADHSHVFTIGGNPKWGHSIVEKMDNSLASDGTPMTVLGYANGPGPQQPNFTSISTSGIDFRFPSGIHLDSETHGGEDVAVLARGPLAHLVTGVQEQTVVAHIMAYASCIGLDKSHCTDQNSAPGGATRLWGVEWLTMVTTLLIFLIASG